MSDMHTEHPNTDGAERAAARIAELLPALLRARIQTIAVDYDGSDDQSSFHVSPTEIPDEVRRILDEHLPSILPPGWNEDVGGFGTLTIDATRRTLAIDHHSRYSNEDADLWTMHITPGPAAVHDHPAAIAALLNPLREAGITQVHMHYDGSGDSGSIERIEPATIPKALQDELEDHAYHLLPGGWEINDGSHGIITIDVNQGRLTVDHRWRTTDTEHSRHSYQLF